MDGTNKRKLYYFTVQYYMATNGVQVGLYMVHDWGRRRESEHEWVHRARGGAHMVHTLVPAWGASWLPKDACHIHDINSTRRPRRSLEYWHVDDSDEESRVSRHIHVRLHVVAAGIRI